MGILDSVLGPLHPVRRAPVGAKYGLRANRDWRVRGAFRGRVAFPPNWEKLESEEAKLLRGAGWWNFCRMIRKERGKFCQECKVAEVTGKNPKGGCMSTTS